MSSSFQVRFWNIRSRKGRRRPYEVRWVVGDRSHSESFVTWEHGDSFRARLITAARTGEAFDTETGLPESIMRAERDVSWFQHAVEYVDSKWPRAAAKTRASMLEGLTAVTTVLVRDVRGAPEPEVLRRALRRWAFNVNRRDTDQPDEIKLALDWIDKASIPVSALQDPVVVTKALNACASQLNGQPAAPEYYRRRRRVLYNALGFAVDHKRLATNPLKGQGVRDAWKTPKVVEEVDPRSVGNPAQIRELLTMTSYVGRRQGARFVSFFGCMYYAMMRPAEVTALKEANCRLPERGWGELILDESRPAAGRDFTDTGTVHEDRGLKGRPRRGPRRATRSVPIPPVLVAMLRRHIDTFGVAPDGRLFRSESGAVLPPSTYRRVWYKTRTLALPPDQHASPLMRRPYDLRHAGVTWRLNAGVPPTQVAEWAGHSVEVLMRIYAKCVRGYDAVWIDRMNRALDQDSGDEE